MAQRAIPLLLAAIERDFGLKVLMGAELEFGYANSNENCKGDLGGLSWDRKLRKYHGNYYRRTGKDIPLDRYGLAEEYEGTNTKSEYLNQNRYLRHLYWDEGRLEAVFSHSSKATNPLRLAGAIETFKKHLFDDIALTGDAEVTLSPQTD